tara:strand:+ start:442 stop:546 length:105 start_codon:yes stop_codon:yes gene_type:complete
MAVAAINTIDLVKDPLFLILATDHLIENIIEFKI